MEGNFLSPLSQAMPVVGMGYGRLAVFVLARPVYLVGFMGSGKTSVGRRVARNCKISSVDLDNYIERQQDRKIAEIFADEGEDAFRALETQALQYFADNPEKMLVSCGGGIVLAEENRRILKESGYVIYLEVSAEEAAARIHDTESRPLFGDMENAQRTLLSRIPLYEEVADISIDTNGKPFSAVAREVRVVLEGEGLLWQLRG